MGIEGLGFDELEGVSPSFAEALYRRYRADPQSVEPDWRDYFKALEATVSGPSWARSNWPPSDTDALTEVDFLRERRHESGDAHRA